MRPDPLKPYLEPPNLNPNSQPNMGAALIRIIRIVVVVVVVVVVIITMIIIMGLWGYLGVALYYDYNNEPPKLVEAILKAPSLRPKPKRLCVVSREIRSPPSW